ncbi:MAG: excinuclease ABC subunit UvrA, partial [Patescibacteria group bacterium]|nr:excinuclease ABC subunit UvrA [Patescibacteria group bacterium]
MKDFIVIKGARQHNLKNIDLQLPKNQLVVFTGLSGSGKSSLAFDTLYAEGQRRYVESLSSYARQFLGLMDKPDVDSISGLSPAIAIDQKTTSHNPRSTVGTTTEIYDYLRLLYARVGRPHCPHCHQEISQQSLDQIIDQVYLAVTTAAKQQSLVRFMILSPIIRDKKGEFLELFKNLRSQSIQRARIDNQVYSLNEDLTLIKTNRHTIEAVIERLTFSKTQAKDAQELKQLKSR